MFNTTKTNTIKAQETINQMRQNIRFAGTGFQVAKKEWNNVPANRYENKAITEVDRSASIITRVLSWYDSEMPGAQSSMCEHNFVVNYNIYCDVNRMPVAGENTLGTKINVTWETTPVEVRLVSSALSTVLLEQSVGMAINGSAKDLSTLAKNCGFKSNEMKELHSADVDKLLCTLKTAAGGQSKLTRLVKGFLLFRDLLHHENQRTTFNFHPNVVNYSIAELVNRTGYGDSAYVWCDAPSSVAYAAALYSMCEEYPNPNIQTYAQVKIPADADNVYLVSRGVFSSSQKITLTSDVMWAALLKYCDVMSLGNCLDEVAVIASSLAENRYHTTLALPRVVSMIDLVYPATVKRNMIGYTQKPYLTINTMRCIGRTHQMLSFVALKDIVVSAFNSTANNLDPFLTIQSYLKVQSFNFTKYMNVSDIVNLLIVTRNLDFLRFLTPDDAEAIYGTSVFEGLWVVDRMNDAMAKGIIANMKQGRKDRMKGHADVYTHQDYMGGLRRELELAQIKHEDKDISEGDWTIKATSLTHVATRLKSLTYRTRAVSYEIKLKNSPVTLPRQKQAFKSRSSKTRAWMETKGTGMSNFNPPIITQKVRSHIPEADKVIEQPVTVYKNIVLPDVEHKYKDTTLVPTEPEPNLIPEVAKTRNIVLKTQEDIKVDGKNFKIVRTVESEQSKEKKSMDLSILRKDIESGMALGKYDPALLDTIVRYDFENQKAIKEGSSYRYIVKIPETDIKKLTIKQTEESQSVMTEQVVANVELLKLPDDWEDTKEIPVFEIEEPVKESTPRKKIILNKLDMEYFYDNYKETDSMKFFLHVFNSNSFKPGRYAYDLFIGAAIVDLKRCQEWFDVVSDDQRIMDKVNIMRMHLIEIKYKLDGDTQLRNVERLVWDRRAYSGPFDDTIRGHFRKLTHNPEMHKLLGLLSETFDNDEWAVQAQLSTFNLDWRIRPLLLALDEGMSVSEARTLSGILGSDEPSEITKHAYLGSLITRVDAFSKYYSKHKKEVVFHATSSMTEKGDDKYNIKLKDRLVVLISVFTGELCVQKKHADILKKKFHMGTLFYTFKNLADPNPGAAKLT